MLMIQLAIVMNRAPQKAEAKSATSNPGTNEEANQNSSALITKVNKPRVKMFTGKVKMIRIGFMRALINPKTRAAISADKKLWIVMPGTK